MRSLILIPLLSSLVNRTLAAISLHFDLAGDDATQKTFKFTDVGLNSFQVDDMGATKPSFTVVNTSMPLPGATGSVQVTWNAKDKSSPEDAASWTFGPDATITSRADGLGVKSAGETAGFMQLGDGEAFVLSFDVSGLTLVSGSVLRFTIICAGGETYRIFKRSATVAGTAVFNMTNANSGADSDPIAVASGYSASSGIYHFAITDPGWDGGTLLRIKGFSIDVQENLLQAQQPPDSQIILDFNVAGTNAPQKVFLYTNVGSANPTVVDKGAAKTVFTLDPSSTNLDSASGSLSVTWNAKETQNAPAWSFGQAAIVESRIAGLGVQSTGESGRTTKLGPAEAFTVAFNTSNLSLSPGSRLVFTVRSAGTQPAFRIYQRTAANTGTVVFTQNESTSVPVPSDLVDVMSGYASSPDVYEFAIADSGWAAGSGKYLRIDQFAVGIVGAPVIGGKAPSFHTVFTDNMMLQRDANVTIYGTATPGSTVTVTFGTLQSKSTTTDTNGSWSVLLDPMLGSYTARKLTATSGARSTSINNVLVGDIWLCSGQSNMETTFKEYWTLRNTSTRGNPFIRLMKIEFLPKKVPSDTLSLDPSLDRSWQECTPDTVLEYPPAPYFFAAKMEADNNVPIGLMQTARCCYLESWMSKQALVSLGVDPNFEETITTYYNGMIYPLRRFAFKGVLFYHGEASAQDAASYYTRFPALINDWRALFSRGNFPFYYAQIASRGVQDWDVTDTARPYLREAQEKTLALPNTRMIVLMDVGEFNDQHPQNKQAVGERWARWGLLDEGHTDVNTHAPKYKNMTIAGNKVTITFSDVGAGLETRELKMNFHNHMVQGEDPDAFVIAANKLGGFTVAGPNLVFVDAEANITASNKVTLSSPYVNKPVAVRYCFKWFDLCNLYAANDGLVALPFRTDKISIPNFFGYDSGVLFDGNFTALGDKMLFSLNAGTSLKKNITIKGVNAYSISSTTDIYRHAYFKTNNPAFQNGPKPYVIVKIVYYDQGPSSGGVIKYQFDGTYNATTMGNLTVPIRNTLTWRVVDSVLREAFFGKRLLNNDLHIYAPMDMILNGVYLSGV